MSHVERPQSLSSGSMYLEHRGRCGETLVAKPIGILRAHPPDLSLHPKHRQYPEFTMLGHLVVYLLDVFVWIRCSNFIEYISFRIGEPEIQVEYAEHAIS